MIKDMKVKQLIKQAEILNKYLQNMDKSLTTIVKAVNAQTKALLILKEGIEEVETKIMTKLEELEKKIEAKK